MFNRILSVTVLSLVTISVAIAQSATPSPITQRPSSKTITYTNTQYGFRFALPKTWEGYTILTNRTWDGTLPSPSGTEEKQFHGPILVIRNPHWTEADPHEDIPIEIFTRAQWRKPIVVGAAPIDPTKLGQNARYVFVLPARYNYDYATGWEEVEKIMATKPLHTF